MSSWEEGTNPHRRGRRGKADSVAWPGGARAAAAFTFDVDAESAVLWGSPGTADRMSVISHQAYGPLVGVPRLLDLLERHGIRSTFFVPGYTAHRYPDVVRRLVDAGHEIAHHGYLHEQPTALTEAGDFQYRTGDRYIGNTCFDRRQPAETSGGQDPHRRMKGSEPADSVRPDPHGTAR